MKTAVLTGSTGFLGRWLLEELVRQDVFVYAVCRKHSPRRAQLEGIPNICAVEMDMDQIEGLPARLAEKRPAPQVFYHLAWEGPRNDFEAQYRNVAATVQAQKAAAALGCTQFICTGSQAEYGLHRRQITEETPLLPTTAYGACKAAAYHLTRVQGQLLGLPTVWVRVFSVYGPRDNPNTLISYLMRCWAQGHSPKVSAAHNKWDFLYAADAAEALRRLGEGKDLQPVYNLAFGGARPLREYILEARDLCAPGTDVRFGDAPREAVWLDVNVEKIKRDIGWRPGVSFAEGIRATWAAHTAPQGCGTDNLVTDA